MLSIRASVLVAIVFIGTALAAVRVVQSQGIQALRQKAAEGAAILREAFQRESRRNLVQQEYERLRSSGGFTVQQTTAEREVQDLVNRLNRIVDKKISSLKAAVRFSEKAVVNYTMNPYLEERHVSYISAKTLNDSDARMQYDRMFLQSVVMNESSVYIPNDMFNGDVEALNEIVWSTKLDEIFNHNKRKDPDLLWQYFGSQRGIFRIFPGMKWRKPKNEIDMYDVRRRPWYTQGSSSPKDILFLIDTSGSMLGQSLTLTKHAVKSLIDTLGENDFIAVAQYPGKQVSPDHTAKPHLIEDQVPSKPGANLTCFKSFVQATQRNKKRLFNQIMNLEAYGIVNFNDVIEFAYHQFELFQNQSVSNQGAMCNSIIMILSDGDVSGDVQSAKHLISQWRKKSNYLNMIRIFTYSVGQHQNPIEPLLEIACENRGFFAEIPARGAVNHQAQHVTTVLSRPMTLYSADFYQWHNIYLDSLGLGLMTSITLPLYNASGNQSFMGLIGTDVTVKELQAMVPFHKFGPRGYAFAVNANGYIVFHPELKAQNGWLRDPPNVDLIEMEFDSLAKRQVRKRIVNTTGSSGSSEDGRIHRETIGTLLKIPDDVHTTWAERTYAFTNVNSTVFAISVVMPPEGNRFAVFNDAIRVSVSASNNQQPPVENATARLSFQIEIEQPNYSSFSSSIYAEPNRKTVRYPSKSFDYTVPTKMPYCTEYYIPPSLKKRKRQPLKKPLGESVASPAMGASAAPNVQYPNRRPWVHPSAQPPTMKWQGYSEINETFSDDDTELIRNAPANMANLLQTFLHNGSSLCHSHWVKAVALDMALYETFFERLSAHRMSNLATTSAAQSVFLTGLSGVMGVQPANETWRYDSWREGWFEGYYQRAFEQADVIFASVVPFKTGEIFQSLTTTPDPLADFYYSFNANSAAAAASGAATSVRSTTSAATAAAGADREPRTTTPMPHQCAQCRPSHEAKRKSESSEPPPVTMFQAVTLADGFKVAVVGATLPWRWISQSIFNSSFGALCDLHRANNTCYLLEDGGYIVSANENFQAIGHFLGHVDKPLMRHLVFNLSVYSSEKEYDYQASCPKKPPKRTSKSANPRSQLVSRLLMTLPPISALLLTSSYPVGLVNALLWLAAPISSQEATSSVNINESCIKLGYRYYRRPQAAESFESLDGLGRKISVLFLNGTNLILAAVSKPPSPLDPALLMPMTIEAEFDTAADGGPGLDYLELRREAKEDPGPDVCTLEPRFRSRPTSCYNWHPKEDSSECGSSNPSLSFVGFKAFGLAFAVTLLAFNFNAIFIPLN